MTRSLAVIFDLDGTLVDSSYGVLSSLQSVLIDAGIEPSVSLEKSLIGPPLHRIMEIACPNADKATIQRLIISFKNHYDSSGCLRTEAFLGVNEMLHSLYASGICLHIATNKRISPTLKILDHLGWSRLFDQVISPDSSEPSLPSKAAILSRILEHSSLEPVSCCYVGDRLDDYQAASKIGIPFVLAEWGYEGADSVLPINIRRMKSPDASALAPF